MPIDVALWNLVQENKAAVVRALIRQFDPSQGSPYPIYTDEGEFTYGAFRALAGLCAIHRTSYWLAKAWEWAARSQQRRLRYYAHVRASKSYTRFVTPSVSSLRHGYPSVQMEGIGLRSFPLVP